MPLNAPLGGGRTDRGFLGAAGKAPGERAGGRPVGAFSRLGGLWPYALPAGLFLGVFVGWPVLRVCYLSLFEWNLISPTKTFVGLGNFAGLFGSAEFFRVLLQSLLYVGVALLGNFLLPLVLAGLTLRVGGRCVGLYQSLLFTPAVVAVSVGALLWQWIYLPTGGLLNGLLSVFGLSGGNWLNDDRTALSAVGVVAVWKFMGFNYLIALAGLTAVPKEYLEAAKTDGAAGWPLLRWVLVPLLMPTILFVMLTAILQALPHVFVPVEVLTRGGPSNASNNLLYTAYQDGFQFFRVGTASAESVLILALFGGAAVWQFSILDRHSSYDR